MPFRHERLTVLAALLMAAVSVALAVGLAESYRILGEVLGYWLLGTQGDLSAIATWLVAAFGGGLPWLAAALVHTVLALVVIARFAMRRDLATLFVVTRPANTHLPFLAVGGRDPRSGQDASVTDQSPAGIGKTPWLWLAERPWRMYLPAIGVLSGSAFLVVVSRLLAGAPPPAAAHAAVTPLAWILWVPPVEELVFRAGIYRLYRRFIAGTLWPAWFAALTFALVHASPTIGHLITGRVGLPLGPFLLGLAAAAVFLASGRLAPAVALHAACNATATVFILGDPRWLDWLGFLYG